MPAPHRIQFLVECKPELEPHNCLQEKNYVDCDSDYRLIIN